MTALAKRSCGPCKACCSELKIATPQFRKKAHSLCRHHDGAGCGIYDTRYAVCRDFLCGWRLFAELDDNWRPDRSGVLVLRKGADEIDPAWRAPGYGVQLAITGGEEAVTRPGFAEQVLRLLSRGIAVYLSAASPATLVNDHLDAGTGAAEARGTLLHLYRMLHAARWQRGVGMLWPLYRLQVERQRAIFAKKLNQSGI